MSKTKLFELANSCGRVGHQMINIGSAVMALALIPLLIALIAERTLERREAEDYDDL